MPKRKASDDPAEQLRSVLHRRERFDARADWISAALDPLPGEFTLRVTYNGRQWHNLTFTPEEWHRARGVVDRFLAPSRR